MDLLYLIAAFVLVEGLAILSIIAIVGFLHYCVRV